MKQILPVLFLFLLVIIFPQFALAGPVISISSPPSSVVAGEEFIISFQVSGLSVSSSYFMKALGGNNFSEVDTWNSSWLQQNASWTSMPEFSSDVEGNVQTTIKARFDSSTTAGSKEFKIRIRKSDNTTNYDSSVVDISVSVTTPTILPTADPTPSETPTPTPATPTPTISKSTYKINKPKDQSGGYLSSVKINIDNVYTHHEDDETLDFCPDCYCDAEKQVPCGLGAHTITLTKAGFTDWFESRNFIQGESYEVFPVLTVISISPSATPTNSPTPTSTPSLRGGTPEFTRPGGRQSSPLPSLSPSVIPGLTRDPSPSSPSSVLGDSTDSATVSLGTLGSSPSHTSSAIGGSASGRDIQELTSSNSALKYTFIFGALLSAGSGGWLYFRHKKD